MDRLARIIEITIIIAGVFISLAAIPYLVNVENPQPQLPVKTFEMPEFTAPVISPTINSKAEQAPVQPAPIAKAVLPVKTDTAPATLPQPIAAPAISKYGALLKEEARLGRVDPRDEQELWRGVVAVKCSFDVVGGVKTLSGSGIVLNNFGYIATNNHVANGGSDGACQIQFPGFSENTGFSIRALGAVPAKIVAVSGNNDNDIALLQIEQNKEFREQLEYWKKYYGFTGDPFPFIPYPFCDEASQEDRVMHFDWQVINSASGGFEMLRVVSHVIEFLNINDGEFFYARSGAPDYVVTDAKKFGGSSGGLAFNATRDCILGLTSRSGEVTFVLNINSAAALSVLNNN